MKKTTTILAIGSGLFLSNAQAEIESEFHVGYNSKYIYRGVDLGDDAFEYGLDFAGSCDCGLDWSAGIWGISPDGEDGNVDELDIYAAVSKTFGDLTVAAGFTAYTYDGNNNQGNSTQDDSEVWIGASGELYGFDAGATFYFGTDGALQEQSLLELSLGYSHSINDTTTANLGLVYGYLLDEGDGGYGSSDGAAYFSATFSLDVAISDEMTLSPYVSYIDGGSRIGGSVSDEVIGGGTLSFAF